MSYKLIPANIDWRRVLQERVSAIRKERFNRLPRVMSTCRAKKLDDFLSGKHLIRSQKYYERVYYGSNCGRFGKLEKYADGSELYKPFFCNERHGCWDCFRRGRRAEYLNQVNRIEAVAEAQKISDVLTPVYTLWPEIRNYISTRQNKAQAKIINEIVALAVESFKQLLGVGGRRGNGVTGIVAVVHPHGSRNPFVPFIHIHLICVPVVIEKSGLIRKLDYFLDHETARAIWFEAQDRFCVKHGITHGQKEVDLHLQYINTRQKARLRHRMKYTFRALTDDVLGSVKYVDQALERFVWLETVDEGFLPHVASWQQFSSALDMSMEFPTRLIRSYGFFHMLNRYAHILGIVPQDKNDPGEPITTVPCEFKRTVHRRFDKDSGHWGFVVKYFVSINQGPWKLIDGSSIVGESCTGSSARRWDPG